ncbi:hypothetical protein GGX14DRAFT_581151 [Mycena pura]|uniref:Uncharacterized protein n=1 Tax=Mycena pura TaxID=153505 RepID=A0AAD6UJJ1_9AGAR|nr:hypothetical protein GGX14DRAFT_581151 [Mycena pura]
MPMLWTHSARKTRSSTVFAAWTTDVFAVQAATFDIAPLLLKAVAVERDGQEDLEPDDALNDIDDAWPPLPEPDPWNEVDDLRPAPEHCALPTRKRCASPTYDRLVATGTPLSGPHRRRATQRARKIAAEGHTSRASTLREYVAPAEPICVPTFDASGLPSARGAYAAVVEQKVEKHGHKKRRSVAELLGLGFQLFQWDGVSARPLSDSAGRIFAVLAGQPDNHEWRAAVLRTYDAIKQEGAAADFPTDMWRHRRGLFAAINVGLSYGKGLTAPTSLDTKTYAPLVDRLLANTDIIRMANFSGSLAASRALARPTSQTNASPRLVGRQPSASAPQPP